MAQELEWWEVKGESYMHESYRKVARRAQELYEAEVGGILFADDPMVITKYLKRVADELEEKQRAASIIS